jgi:superfamily II DNA or RNA helicase
MTNPNAMVQVCSQATLMRRRHLPHADLVLVDEVHIFYDFYAKWMEKWDQIPFIGLSATPYTKGLGKHFQQLISTATTQELIDEGSLSDFKVWAPSTPDLSKVKIVAGDYSEDQLAAVMNQADLVGDIVQKWKQLAENRPTFCYAVDRAHARAIQRKFQEAGIEFEYIDAYTTREERDVIKKQFHDGRVVGVVSVGCLVKGVDWDVRCIILARPTKSDSLYQQIIGRGLRTADGKDFCLVIDHTGTTLRLGFVTDVDDRHTVLDMGKKQKNTPQEKVEPLPKECPQCKFVKPVKVWECPNCGYKPERQHAVVEAQGQLEELTRTQKKNNKNASPEQKKSVYGQFLWYCREKGKKPGYAANLYKRLYGVWPNRHKDAIVVPPSPEILSYITAMNIRYARGSNAKAN